MVRPLTPTEEGLWLCPPLPIAQRIRPYIPHDAWPDLVREKEAGVSVQELAARWDVSPMTVRHTLQKAHQQGLPPDSS